MSWEQTNSRLDRIEALLVEGRDAAVANKTNLEKHIVPVLEKHIKQDEETFKAHEKRIRFLEKSFWTATGIGSVLAALGSWFISKGAPGG